jgi:hypothetical protein
LVSWFSSNYDRHPDYVIILQYQQTKAKARKAGGTKVEMGLSVCLKKMGRDSHFYLKNRNGAAALRLI